MIPLTIKLRSNSNPKQTKVNIFRVNDNEQLNLIDSENRQSKINDNQPRSPAITIIRSNNHAPPQVEPFYRPKYLPVSNQQQLTGETAADNFVSHSLPTNAETGVPSSKNATKNNSNEKKTRSQASEEHPEEPRTPHSRAKNITRFYPVTKDASVVKPDVSLNFFLLDSE